jgi:D-aminopeptidase
VTDHDPHRATPAGKPRARALGIPFAGRPGRWNAITDVPGVEVGYVTLIEGTGVRTGVTAIHPRGRAGAGDPVAAGFHSQNGNGEMTGVSWIAESGTFTGPVAITNTHAVGIAHAGIVAWAIEHHPAVTEAWLLPVAAETWDGYLNDINGHHVTEESVVAALEAAGPGPVEEGSVGGGTGMNCYEFKGGSGTASRLVPCNGTEYTVGVFLQANFGGREELVLAGLPLGEALKADNPMADDRPAPPGAGSVIAVVVTDAPLFPHQTQALARRVTLGLARTGTSGSHFSGDLFLACSTANPAAFRPDATAPEAPDLRRLDFIPWEHLDPFYEAVVQATEEAVVNALVANEDMTGRDGHRTPALPREQVAELLARAGRLSPLRYAEQRHRILPAHRPQPRLAEPQPGQRRDLPRVRIGNVREVAAEQHLARHPELAHQRQRRDGERRQRVEELGEDHRRIKRHPLMRQGEPEERLVVRRPHMRDDRRQPRMPRQHRPERPRPGVLVPHRRVPRMHHHRHSRLGKHPPHRVEQRIKRREPAHLQVDLEDPRPVVKGAAHVPRHPGLRVERRRRQAPRRGLRERHRPRVQVDRHPRPVRVRERAEHLHPHAPQVCHPLLVAPLVPDRPADPPDQRPGRVKVLPHSPQHPRRQEMRMHVRQPRHPERPPEPRDVGVLLRW